MNTKLAIIKTLNLIIYEKLLLEIEAISTIFNYVQITPVWGNVGPYEIKNRYQTNPEVIYSKINLTITKKNYEKKIIFLFYHNGKLDNCDLEKFQEFINSL